MVTLSWEEVKLVHKTIAGIYVQNGLPVSILVNQQKGGVYSDRVRTNQIMYVLNRNTQTHGINALLSVVGTPHRVRAFEKKGTNKWLDLGSWKAKEVAETGDDGAIEIHFSTPG
jgi:hypothetical protein